MSNDDFIEQITIKLISWQTSIRQAEASDKNQPLLAQLRVARETCSLLLKIVANSDGIIQNLQTAIACSKDLIKNLEKQIANCDGIIECMETQIASLKREIAISEKIIENRNRMVAILEAKLTTTPVH